MTASRKTGGGKLIAAWLGGWLWLLVVAGALAPLAHAGVDVAPRGTLVRPQISGSAVVGGTLTCTSNSTDWGGSPGSYTYQWYRNETLVQGGFASTYVVTDADVGQQITCRATGNYTLPTETFQSLASSPVTPTSGSGDDSGGDPPALPDGSTLIDFPSDNARCKSRRKFRIRIRQISGVTYTSAEVFVNGKKVKVVKGSRLTAPVNLRGLPAGTFKVKITVTTDDGRTISAQRKYKTCAKKRSGKKRRL